MQKNPSNPTEVRFNEFAIELVHFTNRLSRIYASLLSHRRSTVIDTEAVSFLNTVIVFGEVSRCLEPGLF